MTNITESPRVAARIAGQYIVPLTYEINRNGHGVLDTATITLPVKGNPDWVRHLQTGKTLDVYIRAGFPHEPSRLQGGNATQSLYQQLSQRFSGTADPIKPRFADDLCSLECRSFGAILAATRTTTNLGGRGVANLAGVTTVDYLKSVAKTHGFTTKITIPQQPATMQQVYAHEQLVGIQNLYIWDILVYCAETDGVYIWVDGSTIHYENSDAVTRPVIRFEWMKGISTPETFEGMHSPQFAKDAEVEVRSYTRRTRTSVRTNVRGSVDQDGNVTNVTSHSTSVEITQQNFGNPGQTSVSSTYSSENNLTTGGSRTSSAQGQSQSVSTGGSTSSGFTSVPTDSGKTKYIFTIPNLTQAQCDALAMKKWQYISAHEFSATFSLPITREVLGKLGILTKFFITKLPWSSFDQGYICKRQTERFEAGSGGTNGFTLEVDGINHKLPQGAV